MGIRSQVTHYSDLIARQKSMDLVTEVYAISCSFPADERFGLTNHIRRAAVSVPSNMAEGFGKQGTGAYLQSLGHARGSLYEVRTQMEIAQRLQYIPSAPALMTLIDDCARLLNGLIKSLKPNPESL